MAAALGVLLLAVGGILVVDATLFSPERTVRGYFSALADRDAEGVLNRMVEGGAGEYALLTAETLHAEGYEPPAALRVLETLDLEPPDAGYADSGYTATAGFFRRWRIMDGVEVLDVVAPGVDKALVAGREVVLDSERGAATVAAFPGTYRVGLSEHPLWVAGEPAVRVGGATTEEGDGRAVAVLDLAIKDGVESVVDEKVRAFIDGCAEAVTLSPPSCPLSAYHWMEVRDVQWRIIEYPEYRLVSNDGRLLVVTGTAGRAEVAGTEVSNWSGTTAPYREEVTFSADGTVSAPGGEVTYTPA
ncbi:hypothetical protein FHR83_006562 [Actinoplanes campanulatus]|uniref:Uncharacterized protein n=1 Tax=Actinoplanes campanulatus TaxID=113559 RepID=A0A7W5AM84_9ACTN|nr:hypothetical protein [Actinoplanes campanulatus]MBB3098863.1 hypothetical protein [Actinoplanes campanulatus]GGN36655.1 hypothetical protein GCM10010109_61830 [Actinoplanes campanulatus]GID42000.1 hypothetical protein Aca09nite_85060 [Actinoplanes campanulatus]